MMNLKQKLIAFVKEEEGLTTVEYAVAGTMITLAVVAAFRLLGGTVSTKITAIDTELNS